MIPPCAVWHLLIQINHLHPSSFPFPTRIMLYMLYHHPVTSVSHTQQHTVSIIHILLPLERKYKQRKIQPHNHHLFILRKKKRQSLLFVFTILAVLFPYSCIYHQSVGHTLIYFLIQAETKAALHTWSFSSMSALRKIFMAYTWPVSLFCTRRTYTKENKHNIIKEQTNVVLETAIMWKVH